MVTKNKYRQHNQKVNKNSKKNKNKNNKKNKKDKHTESYKKYKKYKLEYDNSKHKYNNNNKFESINAKNDINIDINIDIVNNKTENNKTENNKLDETAEILFDDEINEKRWFNVIEIDQSDLQFI